MDLFWICVNQFPASGVGLGRYRKPCLPNHGKHPLACSDSLGIITHPEGGIIMKKRNQPAVLLLSLALGLAVSACGATSPTATHAPSALVEASSAAASSAASASAGASVSITASGSRDSFSLSGRVNLETRDQANEMPAAPAPGMTYAKEAGIMPSPQPDDPFFGNPEMDTEDYDAMVERAFVSPMSEPLSTFSADVDTASWSNIRRFLNMGMAVPPDAVRIEEMLNYFPYGYAEPTDNVPFAVHPEMAVCPWNTSHLLMRVGIQGKRIDAAAMPVSNLVFLLDVSGSMDDPLKLPLVKSAFQLLVENLKESDRISIVTYAGAERIVLNGATGDGKAQIQAAINDLEAGGSTAGAQGLITAYQLATENFLTGGNNRVILATDGDFNVGLSSDGDLVRLIEREREKGIFLSVLGFGTGNVKDNKMEKLADNGNGNYAYIDSIREAQKVLVGEMGGTLFTIAKDVKFQIEFNPAMVKGYRLIGYENRMMADEDFNNDRKDAGDIGAGHSMTALYEIIPSSSDEMLPGIDPLKYQEGAATSYSDAPAGMESSVVPLSDEWMTIKIRYKEPDASTSKLISIPIGINAVKDRPSDDFAFQASVAEAGLVLRNSAFRSNASMDHAVSMAASVLGTDHGGYRQEFVGLMKRTGSGERE